MDVKKIYGIEIDEALQGGGEKRLMDATGLKNDYAVNDTFQQNGGKNDFDGAYPLVLCGFATFAWKRKKSR